MLEHEQLRSAQRKLDLALYANEQFSQGLANTGSFTPQSAQETAGKFIFYRLHSEQQLRTYRHVTAEFHPEEPPFENELTAIDREEMATALDEAKNGNYQRVRGYIREFLNRWPPNTLDPILARNTRVMIAAIADFGEPFQEPLLPYDDPQITEGYEKSRPLPENPVKFPKID